MKLKIVQAGDPVLRQSARPLSRDEVRSGSVQQLIELMRETMRDAPGVGLAAPQVGEPLQLVVIEDREEYVVGVPPERLAERERAPVPFHVLVNPRLSVVGPALGDGSRLFFEGCLSLAGLVALTPRAHAVRVEALDENGDPVAIDAEGWYARILQHEIDHLHGRLYVDRMLARSFMAEASFARHWRTAPVADVCAALGIVPDRPG